MSNRKTIYLLALSTILLCCVSLTFWVLFPNKWIAWLCLIASLSACVCALLGFKQMYALHSPLANRKNPDTIYKYDFMGHLGILIFSLAFGFLNLTNFKQIAFSPSKSNGVEILISNTSDQNLDEINLKLGTFSRQLKNFSARKQERMTVPLALAATLSIELKHQGQTRQSILLVQPSDHRVLVRLDYNQNILPELH